MAAKNRAFVSKAPALSVRACVYERESERISGGVGVVVVVFTHQ